MQIKFGLNQFLPAVEQIFFQFFVFASPIVRGHIEVISIFVYTDQIGILKKVEEISVFRISNNKYNNGSVQLYFYLEDAQMYMRIDRKSVV